MALLPNPPDGGHDAGLRSVSRGGADEGARLAIPAGVGAPGRIGI